MHIPDGVLSGEVMAAGAIASVIGVAASLRRLNDREMPKVALVAATFFAVSLVHVPIPVLGVTSMHLVLCGMTGALLGIHAFPAMTIALALQAFLYHHGGVASLGNNILNMALPAVIGGTLARRVMVKLPGEWMTIVAAFLGGTTAAAACLLEVSCYVLSNNDYWAAAPLAFAMNLPLIALEAVVTGLAIPLIARSRSDLFGFDSPLNERLAP